MIRTGPGVFAGDLLSHLFADREFQERLLTSQKARVLTDILRFMVVLTAEVLDERIRSSDVPPLRGEDVPAILTDFVERVVSGHRTTTTRIHACRLAARVVDELPNGWRATNAVVVRVMVVLIDLLVSRGVPEPDAYLLGEYLADRIVQQRREVAVMEQVTAEVVLSSDLRQPATYLFGGHARPRKPAPPSW